MGCFPLCWSSGLELPALRPVIGNEIAAGKLVQIFDDHVGIEDYLAGIEDQDRQLLQRRDARILVVRRAWDDGRWHELDLVDEAELDRGDPHFSGEGGRGGEG